MRILYKQLVKEKYPLSYATKNMQSNGYVIYNKGNFIGRGKTAQQAWKNAHNGMLEDTLTEIINNPITNIQPPTE